jgi:hypothetical protein
MTTMAVDPHLNHIPTMKVRAWEDDAGIPFGKFFPPDVTYGITRRWSGSWTKW